MITVRRATDRLHVQRGQQQKWLTFFPRDEPGPLTASFGALVTLDEVHLPPGRNSGPNRHTAGEIVSYVYRGTLAQKDSTGRFRVIGAGEFQCMVAEPRIRYQETNASRTDRVHLFRIALYSSPAVFDLDHAHEQKRFTSARRRNVLCVVASRDGRSASLRLQQDAVIYSSILNPGRHLVHELEPGRSAWLHVVHGEVTLEDLILTSGDGVGVTLEPSVSLTVQENTEILLVDLGPMPDSHGGRELPGRDVRQQIEDSDPPVAPGEPSRTTKRPSHAHAPRLQDRR